MQSFTQGRKAVLPPIRTNIQVSGNSHRETSQLRSSQSTERTPTPQIPTSDARLAVQPRFEYSSDIKSSDAGANENRSAQELDITEQVNQQKEQNRDYQIITRVLIKENKDAVENCLNQASEDKPKKTKRLHDDTLRSESGQKVDLPTGELAAQIERHAVPTPPAESQTPPASNSTTGGDSSQQVAKADPLALDLNGDGFKTTGVHNAVSFDINGDGVIDRSSFIAPGDAFLALDRNGNGNIDNGLELFGDQHAAGNGFLELQKFDENHDNKIDAADSIFDQLKLMSLDSNGNQQLQSLSQAGIRSIGLRFENTQQALNNYDSVNQIGRYEREDGTGGEVGDVMLGYQSLA